MTMGKPATTGCRCSKIMSPLTATRLCHPRGMVTMSQKEFQRVKVIETAVDGRPSVSEAAGLLQLSERHGRCNGSSGATVPTPWLGCITAIVDGPCLGLCRRLCAGPSSNWRATSIRASTILISAKQLNAEENLESRMNPIAWASPHPAPSRETPAENDSWNPPKSCQ